MTTLAKLKTSVDNWLTRDDVEFSGSDFPEILLIAESCIARKLRLIVQEVTTTLTFTGRTQDLPADFLEQRMPFIDDNFRKFEYLTPQAIREHSGWGTSRASWPACWRGTTWSFWPQMARVGAVILGRSAR